MLTKAEIQRLSSLREKKQREKLGLFVVEGEKVVAELLAEKFPFEELYATPDWSLSAARIPTARSITPAEMARISHFPTPSSVLAVGKIQRHPLQPETLNQGLTLALDGIQDAGNFGTLLRIADWFAFERVVASPDCVDVFNQKVINASMGSFARVQVFSAALDAVFAHVSVPILGCDLGGTDVHALTGFKSAVVVIGSEGRGLSPAVRAKVTQFVTIPRYGRAESLNAGIAAAIVGDNLRRAQASARPEQG